LPPALQDKTDVGSKRDVQDVEIAKLTRDPDFRVAIAQAHQQGRSGSLMTGDQ
jgi:hypothetical protein